MIVLNNGHQTRLPLLIICIELSLLDQSEDHCSSEQQQNGDFCIIELYGRYC